MLRLFTQESVKTSHIPFVLITGKQKLYMTCSSDFNHCYSPIITAHMVDFIEDGGYSDTHAMETSDWGGQVCTAFPLHSH